MVLLVASAAVVGFIHSLAPGHWLPVVLAARTRAWSLKLALVGALVAASGHVLVSAAVGVGSIALESQLLVSPDHHAAERYGAVLLIAFGLAYAAYGYFRHSRCAGHGHHYGAGAGGPDLKDARAPFVFLFSIGLFPCVAVLPVFVAASTGGWFPTLAAIASFSIGVGAALVGATWVVSLGLLKLDHPVFEHFGDVLTGTAVALMGSILLILSPAT
jgi:nickel/cobalt transporter (NicO) family protein